MYFLYILIRILLFPIVRFVLPVLSSKARKRVDFELKNLIELNSLSRADYAFEVSSEGELEQVKSLILHLLKKGNSIELVFCSESVEHQCSSLRDSYPSQVRIFRYPIITFRPFSSEKNVSRWLTAKNLILCRYDFFPELIHYGRKPGVNFLLLSGAAQTFSQKGIFSQMYLKSCYHSFAQIVAATSRDKECFISNCKVPENRLDVFDFRALNILKRIENREDSIKQRFNIFFEFESLLLKKKKNKIMLGSFWANECSAFVEGGKFLNDEFYNDNIICIAPHKLDSESIKRLYYNFEQLGISFYTLNSSTTKAEFENLLKQYNLRGGFWVFEVKGVLCELYKSFDSSYIGGGFGESIHSVLEPFLSGNKVFIGPKNQRSSELIYIKELDKESVVEVDKLNSLVELIAREGEFEIRESSQLISQITQEYERIIAWLKFKNI